MSAVSTKYAFIPSPLVPPDLRSGARIWYISPTAKPLHKCQDAVCSRDWPCPFAGVLGCVSTGDTILSAKTGQYSIQDLPNSTLLVSKQDLTIGADSGTFSLDFRGSQGLLVKSRSNVVFNNVVFVNVSPATPTSACQATGGVSVCDGSLTLVNCQFEGSSDGGSLFFLQSGYLSSRNSQFDVQAGADTKQQGFFVAAKLNSVFNFTDSQINVEPLTSFSAFASIDKSRFTASNTAITATEDVVAFVGTSAVLTFARGSTISPIGFLPTIGTNITITDSTLQLEFMELTQSFVSTSNSSLVGTGLVAQFYPSKVISTTFTLAQSLFFIDYTIEFQYLVLQGCTESSIRTGPKAFVTIKLASISSNIAPSNGRSFIEVSGASEYFSIDDSQITANTGLFLGADNATGGGHVQIVESRFFKNNKFSIVLLPSASFIGVTFSQNIGLQGVPLITAGRTPENASFSECSFDQNTTPGSSVIETVPAGAGVRIETSTFTSNTGARVLNIATTLSLFRTTLNSNQALPVNIQTGATAMVGQVDCSYNVRDGDGGCISFEGSGLIVADSNFTNNVIRSPFCGGGLVVHDAARGSITVSNSIFTDNTVVYGGAFCLNNLLNCTPEVLLLEAKGNVFTPNHVHSGGVVYFGARPNSKLTRMPDCLESVFLQNNTNPVNVNNSILTGVTKATYPYRLFARKFLQIDHPGEEVSYGTAHPYVAVFDFLNQLVYHEACQNFSICAESSTPGLEILDSPQFCRNDSVVYFTANNVTEGLYNVTFGNSEKLCTNPGVNKLPSSILFTTLDARFSVPPSNAAYFVSPLGSGTASCLDIANACTFQYVLPLIDVNDTVYFLPGNYTMEKWLHVTAQASFISLNGSAVTFFDLEGITPNGWVIETTSFTFSGFTIQNFVGTSINFDQNECLPGAFLQLCKSTLVSNDVNFIAPDVTNGSLIHSYLSTATFTDWQVTGLLTKAAPGPARTDFDIASFLEVPGSSTITFTNLHWKNNGDAYRQFLIWASSQTILTFNNSTFAPLCNEQQFNAWGSTCFYSEGETYFVGSTAKNFFLAAYGGLTVRSPFRVVWDTSVVDYFVFNMTTGIFSATSSSLTVRLPPSATTVVFSRASNVRFILASNSVLNYTDQAQARFYDSETSVFPAQEQLGQILVSKSALLQFFQAIFTTSFGYTNFYISGGASVNCNNCTISSFTGVFANCTGQGSSISFNSSRVEFSIGTPLFYSTAGATIQMSQVDVSNLEQLVFSKKAGFVSTVGGNINIDGLTASQSDSALIGSEGKSRVIISNSRIFENSNRDNSTFALTTRGNGAEVLITGTTFSNNGYSTLISASSGAHLQLINSAIRNHTGPLSIPAPYPPPSLSFFGNTVVVQSILGIPGTPIRLDGAKFTSDNSECSFNTVPSSGGCISTMSSTISITGGSYSYNTVPPGFCGGVIAFKDAQQSNAPVATLTNLIIEGNDVGFGAAICVDKVSSCPESTLALVQNCTLRNNNVLAGSIVYFNADPGTTQTPVSCFNFFLGGLSSNIIVHDGPLPPPPQKASYPYKLFFRGGNHQPAANAQFNFTINIVDYFDNDITSTPLQSCEPFELCARELDSHGSPLSARDAVIGKCVNLNGRVTFNLVAPESAGSYQMQVGGKDACPSPMSILLPVPDTVVGFSVSAAPGGTPNDAIVAISIGVSFAVLGIVLLIVLSVCLYKRFNRPVTILSTPHRTSEKQRLLDISGIALGATMTKLLQEANVPLVSPDDLDVIETIGAGATGMVVSAKWITNNGRMVAIKQLGNTLTAEGWTETRKSQVADLVTEIQVMVQLQHPYLLPLLGCSVLSDSDVRLILPYMTNRSLAHHITTLPREKVVPIARQLAQGLEYLHTKEFIHGDLKPENILLDETFTVKIADFALSRIMTTITLQGPAVGTPAYMAPELIADGKSKFETDVYAYGIIVFELIISDRAYHEMRPIAIMHKVANESFTPSLPEEFIDPEQRPSWLPRVLVEIVQKCLSRNPPDRPSFKAICDLLRAYE